MNSTTHPAADGANEQLEPGYLPPFSSDFDALLSPWSADAQAPLATTASEGAAPVEGSAVWAPTDPYYPQQWALTGANGLNLGSIQSRYDGTGVRLAVIDNGFDYNHVDLRARYRTDLDFDARSNDSDAKNLAADWHGTAVMAVAGGAANGQGMVGVAPDATLIGVRVGYDAQATIGQYYSAMDYAWKNADIVNNSWGWTVPFSDNITSNASLNQFGALLAQSAAQGRGGLGTVWVFAAGNDRVKTGDEVNAHGFLNNPYAITVAATDSNGKVASFSNPGAAIHVSAPGVGILSADPLGADGAVAGDYLIADGTSFAAPAVSGVIALMLEANKYLGWRDVQEITALAARMTDPGNASWMWNKGTGYNGGGFHHSTDFGFGLLDAQAAIRLAETWKADGTSATMATATGSGALNRTFDAATGVVTGKINLASDVLVHKAVVHVEINHQNWGDLKISLVSASGTESVLLDGPGTAPGVAGHGFNGSEQLSWDLTTEQFWGEKSVGDWTLKVQDIATGYSGTISTWKLTVEGDARTQDNVYVYTDDWVKQGLYTDASRKWIQDSAGEDTLNLSAMSYNVRMDLTPGVGGMVDGKYYIQIRPDTVIENLFGGSGNDVLFGNSADNIIRGGSGNDVMQGNGGDDVFVMSWSNGNDGVNDFSDGDLVILTQGLRIGSSNGTVVWFNDGGSLTSYGGRQWQASDFVVQDDWHLA